MIELLEEAAECEVLPADSAEGELARLRAQHRSVTDLELRMPIVAPMKAGKSTIINAIVGYDLLPARNEAMTTIPTRIELADDLDEPMLELTEADADMFTRLIAELAEDVTQNFQAAVDEFAHLKPLLIALRDRILTQIPEQAKGRARVLDVLTQINDLARLASFFTHERDVVGRLSDAPTLRTPYWHWPELAMGAGRGRLSIVDTPGPDESGFAARLTGAVRDQLEKSHVVLVVLDYTAMGREADEKIKALTDPIVRQLGRSKLYAVVNKVDQRRPGSRDADGVRRFVAVDLGLTAGGPGERVFETKGRLGLVAARTLAALEREGEGLVIAESPAVHDLVWEQFEDPEDREEALATWTHDRLRRRADKKWKESGIPDVLGHVIGRLREKAVPILLESALDLLWAQLTSLNETVELRVRAAAADASLVKRQLKELEGELRQLRDLRNGMPDVESLSRRIQTQLDTHLRLLRTSGAEVLAALSDLPEEGGQHALRKVFDWSVQQAKDLKSKLPAGGKDKGNQVMVFADRDEAVRHLNKITNTLSGPLQTALEYGRDSLAEAATRIADDEIERQDSWARPIIERASRRLAAEFDVELSVPDLRISVGEVEVSSIGLQETTSDTKKTRTVEKKTREWKYWLKIVPRKTTVEEEYIEKVKRYRVDEAVVREKLRAAFNERVDEITREIGGYVADELSAQLKEYYDGLDAFLLRYHGNLEQALEDAGQSRSRQAEITRRLDSIGRRAKEHLTAVEGFKRQLADGTSGT
ncbi:dynamin family protein [Spirillospora sp. NBC_00431]